MKMFGSIMATTLKQLVNGIEKQMKDDHRPRDLPVEIPRDVLVALYHEYTEALQRHFYYELGRSVRLTENRNHVRDRVPAIYLDHFDLGVKDQDAIHNTEEKCLHCAKASQPLVYRGRLAHRPQKLNENADRQQEYEI